MPTFLPYPLPFFLGVTGTPGLWTLVNSARSDVIAGNIPTGSGYKVALCTSASNIGLSSTTWSGVTNEVASGNGYVTGGVAVTLAPTGTTTVAVNFSADPSWTASGSPIVARFVVLYKVSGGNIIAYGLLNSNPTDVTIEVGNSLTIHTANNPIYTLA
jgi:hypothetical protein